MYKAPPGLVKKRKGYSTEPLRKLVIFLTPERIIQFLGFLAIVFILIHGAHASYLEPVDNFFYDLFLQSQSVQKIDPSILYIGIDQKSLQAIKPFPWPKRYYAAITRILREWEAQAIVFNLFFAQGTDDPEDNQALVEEFKKTPNLFLPLSVESAGFKNYYYLNQSDTAFSQYAKGVGHINYSQDPDGTVRRIYPFLKFNDKFFPHLGIQVAFNAMNKPAPSPQEWNVPRDQNSNILIHWVNRWNDVAGYYSFVDILNGYALLSKQEKAPLSPQDFKGKICLIGFTAGDEKKTPLEAKSPGIGVIGNVINTILTREYIRPASSKTLAGYLWILALLSAFCFIPFRGFISFLAGFGVGLLWIGFSFFMFCTQNLWLGIANPILLIVLFFLSSLILAMIQDYKEKLYFLQLAVRDELTGLFVIRYFYTVLGQAFRYASIFHKPFAILMLDVDDFKKINETYGYRLGDEVLKKVAETIQRSIRIQRRALPDAAARYGEEAFIILLVGYNLAEATFSVAERIRKSVEKLVFEFEGKKFSITASLGVSVMQPGEKDSNAIIKRAQEALLRAKASGKNQTSIKND